MKWKGKFEIKCEEFFFLLFIVIKKLINVIKIYKICLFLE